MVYMYTGDVHEIVAGKKCLPVLTHTLTLGSRHDLKWRTIRKLHLSLLTWILKGSLDNHASATAEHARTAEIPLPHATTPTCRKNWSRFQTQQWSGVDSGSRCTLGTKYILWAHHSPSIRSEWVHLKAIYPTTASPTTYNLLQSPFKTPEKAQQNRFSMFFPKDSGQSTKGLLSGAPGDCKMWAIRGWIFTSSYASRISCAWRAHASSSTSHGPSALQLLARALSVRKATRSKDFGAGTMTSAAEASYIPRAIQSSIRSAANSLKETTVKSYLGLCCKYHRKWGAPGFNTLSASTAQPSFNRPSPSNIHKSVWKRVPRWSKNMASAALGAPWAPRVIFKCGMTSSLYPVQTVITSATPANSWTFPGATVQKKTEVRSWRAITYCLNVYIYMGFDQNSFIRERPFFANKNFTFAKLSRTPCLSFAGPMLANNTSYEDSFAACQITPENHGSLLDSLLNMQLASRNPFSGQIVAD